jgi:hypothetical protein
MRTDGDVLNHILDSPRSDYEYRFFSINKRSKGGNWGRTDSHGDDQEGEKRCKGMTGKGKKGILGGDEIELRGGKGSVRDGRDET